MKKILFPQQVNIKNIVNMMRYAYARKQDGEDHFVFDYSSMQHCPAYGLLLSGAFIRQFIEATKLWYPDREVYIEHENYDHLSYQGYLGFFKAIGINWGFSPGEAPGGEKYIPITKLSFDITSTIDSEIAKENLAITIKSTSRKISEMLTRQSNGDLFDNIWYSLVEIFRNVVEHSEQGDCWYCAQFWPTRNKVEIAILDEGIGIYESMKRAGQLPIKDETAAMKYSILPGMSRHGFNTRSHDSTTGIGNSGFGLFMLSQLFGTTAEDHFAMYSGTRLLTYSNRTPKLSKQPLPHLQGTAIRISADTSKFTNIQDRLDELSRMAERVYLVQIANSPSATARYLFGER